MAWIGMEMDRWIRGGISTTMTQKTGYVQRDKVVDTDTEKYGSSDGARRDGTERTVRRSQRGR